MASATELVPVVGVTAACRAVGLGRASFYRHERAPRAAGEGDAVGPAAEPPRANAPGREPAASPAPVHPRALSPAERQAMLETLHSSRFRYLYVILDIFSRYVVGWMVAPREHASLAERLIAETLAKQGIAAGQLTIHADQGSSMISKPVAFLLADLGVTKTHSRPHVSNDNPDSEAHFKTLKYRPNFPDRFASIEEARAFCHEFFRWSNTEHRHSGIGLLPPEVVHHGRAQAACDARAQVLAAAAAAHPERFVRQAPRPPQLPTAAWINPPTTTSTQEVPH